MGIQEFLKSIDRSWLGTDRMRRASLEATLRGRTAVMTRINLWMESGNYNKTDVLALLDKTCFEVAELVNRMLPSSVGALQDSELVTTKDFNKIRNHMVGAWVRGEHRSAQILQSKIAKIPENLDYRDEVLEVIQKDLAEEINFLNFHLQVEDRTELSDFRTKYVGAEKRYFLKDRYEHQEI